MKPKPRYFLIFWTGYQLKSGKSISGELHYEGINFPSRNAIVKKVENKVEKDGFIINQLLELTREEMEHWVGVHDKPNDVGQSSATISYTTPVNPEQEGDLS